MKSPAYMTRSRHPLFFIKRDDYYSTLKGVAVSPPPDLPTQEGTWGTIHFIRGVDSVCC